MGEVEKEKSDIKWILKSSVGGQQQTSGDIRCWHGGSQQEGRWVQLPVWGHGTSGEVPDRAGEYGGSTQDARGALSVVSDELSVLYGKVRGLESTNQQLRDHIGELETKLTERVAALNQERRLRADEERSNEMIFTAACIAGAIFVCSVVWYWFTMP